MNRDPFGSMQGLINQFTGFMQNPFQFMMQRKLNLPQGIDPVQNPQGAIQYLMNSGAMSQNDYNQLKNMADTIQHNPQFMQMFNNR